MKGYCGTAGGHAWPPPALLFGQVSKFSEKLRGVFEHGMRQQVTLLGVVFCFTTVLIGFAAFVSANNLLFLLLAALLATFLIAGFVSRLGLAGLELNLELPEHIAARRNVIGHVLLKNVKRWTPSFSIEVSGAPESGLSVPIYIPVIPGGQTFRDPVQLLFQKRGLYRENTFYLSTRFPFGFTKRRDRLRLEQEILVYPCIDSQAGFEDMLSEVLGELEARQRGRGNDFYRIRPYEALESARHVDWKATAHTGNLQVREFAREQDQTVTVFLDLEVTDKQLAWFEKAIDCAAFLVWRVTRGDTGVRFVTQQFDRKIPEEASVYTILRYLALVTPVRGLAPPYLNDDRSIQIAISADVSRLVKSGWHPHRVLSVDDLSAACAADGPAAAAAREDLNHNRRKGGSGGSCVHHHS